MLQRDVGLTNLGSRVLEISSLARIIRPLIGEAEMKTAIKSLVGLYAAVGIVTLLIQLYWRLFRSHGMRAELRQGRGLVGNLADLL
jgi:hypothetical protein